MSTKIILLFLFFICCVNGELISLFPENVTGLGKTETCIRQLNNIDLFSKLKMIDASTKIPSGLLAGSVYDLGNFDECYNIESKTPTETIYGKYCLGTVQLSASSRRNATKKFIRPLGPETRMLTDMSNFGPHFAICIPDMCTAEEFSSFVTYSEQFCYTQAPVEDNTDTWAIITIVVISIFLGLVLISTIYDTVLYYRKQKTKSELYVAFSALKNGRVLFNTSKNPEHLLCLNGIKAISMMWVIIGHEYSIGTSGALSNFFDLNVFTTDAANMYMLGASASVDSFFLVGGLVTVYTFLKAKDKGVKFNIFLYYLHRFLRLTPAFAIVAMFYGNLIQHLGSGPLWNKIHLLSDPCKDYWWASVFYIVNFVTQGSCVPQTWYLSVDMQLFLLSPIVLIPLVKWPKYALAGIGVLIVLGAVIPFAVVYGYELDAFHGGEGGDTTIYYYIQTHTRFGPYVIGMLLGYIIYKVKKDGLKLKLNVPLAVICWIIGVGGLVACLYAPYDASMAPYSKVTSAVFLALNRNAWAIALSIIVFLCVTDFGGPINAFLSHPVFQFLTKLSYSMYLVHYGLIIVKYGSLKTVYKFSHIQMMMNFWGSFMYTLAISLVLCLTFELPIIILERLLFRRNKTGTRSKNPQV